jgi:hypothetical protein
MLEAEEGTLIVEHGAIFGPKDWLDDRIWWVNDQILTEAPVPPPPTKTYYEPSDVSHPFYLWCAKRFRNEKDGTALLTFPTVWIPENFKGRWSEYLKHCYPRVTVVDTLYAKLVCTCGYRVLSAEAACPRCGAVLSPLRPM